MKPASYFARDGEVFHMVDSAFSDPSPCLLGLDVARRLLPLFAAHGEDPHFKPLTRQLRKAIREAEAFHMEIAA